MKQFIVNRHTVPSTPTLEEVPNEKIRVFKNEATIDAALSSLDENEIVATEDGAESSTRIGNPLGTILAIHSNAVPYGYLPCNGVAFDEHQYPALYALLGDNHTPYSYDKSRLGDWQDAVQGVQEYDGFITFVSNTYGSQVDAYVYINDVAMFHCVAQYATADFILPFKKGDKVTWTANVWQTPKVAYYTHFNVIKATSGLEETQQDYVLQSLLEADSYSTEEVATGKKWIDGKMIYRKVCLNCTTSGSTDSWNNLGVTISGIDKIISHTAINPTDKVSCNLFLLKALSNGTIQYWVWSSIPMNNGLTTTFILEYTKTTD